MNLNIVEEIQATVISVLGQLKDDADIFRYLKVIIENVERENLKGNERKNISHWSWNNGCRDSSSCSYPWFKCQFD